MHEIFRVIFPLVNYYLVFHNSIYNLRHEGPKLKEKKKRKDSTYFQKEVLASAQVPYEASKTDLTQGQFFRGV